MSTYYIVITFIFIELLRKNLSIITFIMSCTSIQAHNNKKKYLHALKTEVVLGQYFMGLIYVLLNKNLGKVSCYFELHSPKRKPLEYHLFLNIKFGLTLLN